jgi:hypothetical protein
LESLNKTTGFCLCYTQVDALAKTLTNEYRCPYRYVVGLSALHKTVRKTQERRAVLFGTPRKKKSIDVLFQTKHSRSGFRLEMNATVNHESLLIIKLHTLSIYILSLSAK